MAEEQRKIKNRAECFDQLVKEPGWEYALDLMTEKINLEIAEATRQPSLEFYAAWPETQRIHMIRWNAKRELLDSMLAYIQDTQKQRDEILEMERLEEGGQRG